MSSILSKSRTQLEGSKKLTSSTSLVSTLYSLIMTSRKPEAKAFKKWVTAEVLPSIRKTGSYGHNSQQQFDLTNLGHVHGVLAALTVQALEDQETIEALKIETKEVTTLVITPPV